MIHLKMILENKYLKKAERAQKFFELILIFKFFFKNIFLHIRNFQQINMCVCDSYGKFMLSVS